MKASVIALVDCNNFFVSCERLFRPDLDKKPVVVLSSNDGCVVSRSNEAKALGIPMGAPAFQYKDVFRREGVYQFSANFELYGDISSRITRTLTKLVPLTEAYSVDESFLDLTQLRLTDYEAWAETVKRRLLKEIGIPVAIGVARSKVLAKIASERTKKDTPDNTILSFIDIDQNELDNYLLRTPIKDVWGVGYRLAPKLKAIGVHTALDLARLDSGYAGQLMGVHGRQMVAELNGQNCHPISPKETRRQSIMHGRMFGEDTNRLDVIEAAVVSLTSKATSQLRREGLLASTAVIVLKTNRHKLNYQRFSRTISLDLPTSNPGIISSRLVEAVEQLITPNTWLHKADVLLYDLIPENQVQMGMMDFDEEQLNLSSSALNAFDFVNKRFGKGTIRLAAEDLSNTWQPKRKLISPHYTTDWQELPLIR
jgi:DNA polymerase V